MTNNMSHMRESMFIVFGDTARLGARMIGEDESADTVMRGSEIQRAAWMTKELLIATIRLAASRKMPVWMPYASKYCSLAALTLSEYISANAAESMGPRLERRQASLNFFHTRTHILGPRRTASWRETFVANGVIASGEKALSLRAALETTQAKRIVCIGTGPRVSAAHALATQLEVKVTTLDFSKASAQRSNKNNSADAGRFEQRLQQSRAKLRTYRARTKQDELADNDVFDAKPSALLYLFPPVPLLVYWQLEHMLPSRES